MPVLEWSETARCDLLAIVYMEDPHVVTVLRVLLRPGDGRQAATTPPPEPRALQRPLSPEPRSGGVCSGRGFPTAGRGGGRWPASVIGITLASTSATYGETNDDPGRVEPIM